MEEYFLSILIIAALSGFGLLIGSFLNVVAIRMLKRESIAYPPSHCVDCLHPLKRSDLIPLFSYMWLRGKCRHCRNPISRLYPFGELFTAVLFGLAAWKYGWTKELAVILFFVSISVTAVLTDFRAMLIPDKLVAAGVGGMILLRIWNHPLPWWDYGIAFFAGSGILYLVALASKGGMGGGDIKLYAFVGLALGIKLTLLSLFLASLFGTMYGLVLLIRGSYRRGMAVPFGPFIVLGAIASLLGGELLLSLYGRML